MTQVQELLQSIQGRNTPKAQQVGEKPDVSFGDTIHEFLQTVNENSKTAAGEVSDIIQDKSENLGQAMISMEESRLSFQLMLEIRNKLLESYNEIQRMQI